MRRDQTTIDSIIKKGKMMSLTAIKNELKIGKNRSLIRVLMEYFMTTIANIDYSTDEEDCIETIRALSYVRPKNDVDFKLIEEYVKQIREIINAKKEKFKNSENTIALLTLLDERLVSFLIEIRFEMISKDEKTEPFPHVDEKRLQTILQEYIFKYKDYSHFNLLLSLCPRACNIKSNGKTIVIRILKNYFTNINDRDFLSKVITLLISNPCYEINSEEKKEIADLCSKYSTLLKVKDLIFIKEVLTTLGISEEIDAKEKMNLLKLRFGLQDVMFDNIRLSNKHFPVNMTDRVALTIDCIGTMIRDDAFSIKREPDGTFELGLYVTDVSSIEKGSPLDIYAAHHFASIYTKDAWVPMIPEPIVYNFSLDNGLRRAIAYTFRFTPDLELIDCEIVPAMIKVRKNLTYFDTIGEMKQDQELYGFLRDALDLADAIGDRLGHINRYHHIKEIVRELGCSVSEIPDKYLDTPGNRIVATFSIFLNNYLATRFDRSGLPFIYRVNDYESSANVQAQLVKYRRDKVMCSMLRSIQTLYKVSTFSDVNTGHKGLGLDAYTQAMSPARYYPSLMIQRMIIDLFILKMPAEEYIKKYQNLAAYVKEFTDLQERNNRFTAEYNKLCRRLTIERR